MSKVLIPRQKQIKIYMPKKSHMKEFKTTEPKEIKQLFFTNNTNTSIMIKHGDITFGIRKNGDKFENYISGTMSNGDSEYINKILGILRNKTKELPFDEITKVLNIAGTATSIRIFYNNLNPRIKIKEKVIRETIKKSLVYVANKDLIDINKAIMHLRKDSRLEYMLFQKNIYYMGKRGITAEKTSYKEKDMI